MTTQLAEDQKTTIVRGRASHSRLRSLAALGLLATCLSLAACGGGGGAASTVSSGAATATVKAEGAGGGSKAQAGKGGTQKPDHHSNHACKDPSYCTAASRATGTFWPTRRRPEPRRNGSVSYAAPSGAPPPPRPGEMALASPAFAVNEPLPAAYTCDGAGISPPLRWRHVPAKAAALVLVVVDASSNGKTGGIRWMVGDIDPHSRGVAAGQVPAGGVVGVNAEGRAGYGAICPAHGRESWVQFQLYALSGQIPLSTGFQPAQAEREYANLLLGHGAASTTAVYVRP